MQAYSLDLRQRVLDACQSGQSEKEVAARFALCLSSVQRYKRTQRATGSLAPKPWPGRASTIKKEQQEGTAGRPARPRRVENRLDAFAPVRCLESGKRRLSRPRRDGQNPRPLGHHA